MCSFMCYVVGSCVTLYVAAAANAEYRETTCWGDMVEDVDSGRIPGRVVHIHEKLSSPSRKRWVSGTCGGGEGREGGT